MIDENYLNDQELSWISHLLGTDGGIALVKWLDLNEARVTRQFLATPPDNVAAIAALQAKMHTYREIRDLLNQPEEQEDEGTRETRFALG